MNMWNETMLLSQERISQGILLKSFFYELEKSWIGKIWLVLVALKTLCKQSRIYFDWRKWYFIHFSLAFICHALPYTMWFIVVTSSDPVKMYVRCFYFILLRSMEKSAAYNFCLETNAFEGIFLLFCVK